MTNVEFQSKLSAMYKEHPIIAINKNKTMNELVYVLRMDKENDYNISTIEDGHWSCIPSVKECYIPVRTLAKHVKSVEYDEATMGCKEICLNVVLKD